jgi:hypothetical protein
MCIFLAKKLGELQEFSNALKVMWSKLWIVL